MAPPVRADAGIAPDRPLEGHWPGGHSVPVRWSRGPHRQSAAAGALPSLYAATEPGLEGGVYVGPDGIGEMRGHPHVVTPSRGARDEATAARLWDVCEKLTSVRFELGAAAAA